MKEERKKLWLKAHIIYQERLKIKEYKQFVDYTVRRVLFAVGMVLMLLFIFQTVQRW